MDILTRLYPCADCASHFKEVIRRHPPQVEGQEALEQYMCQIHNVVNERLGKPAFNCAVVSSRWRPLDCEDDGCGMVGAPRKAFAAGSQKPPPV
ncbi:hypothetical protein QBZ16_000021 [Prototheca wickerhamii]|uniref:Sulfhydryl oxidase n=1 Tax=Prototheca wickerhamii TaxID=3111 RepID=A0AAD9IKT7_PROWI|nr:hypothetical protein QBZ16_000021 [Prototheca wickerhamii]